MSILRYTLAADGPSDQCLVRVIQWLLQQCPSVATRGFVGHFADLRKIPRPPRTLPERLRTSFALFPCDVLFVHRDAEAEPRETRVGEILDAVREAEIPTHVPVVPVRMTEAWLLVEEGAIRRAAGNPNGTVPLDIPPLRRLEEIPDPKQVLRDLLLMASELTGRRRDKFRGELAWRVQRVADLIADFARLRALAAFAAFEGETTQALQSLDEEP